jgi:hypothetical protein
MERFTPSLQDRLRACDVLMLVMPAFDPATIAGDIAWLEAQGVRRVLVIGTKNFGWNPNCVLGMSDADARAFRTPVLEDVMRVNDAARREVSTERFVDLIGLLADEEGRVPLLTPMGELISEDGGHLTRAGARFVGQRLFEHPLMVPFRE